MEENQTVIPGSVSEQDLDKVFAKFVEWVGWDNPDLVPAAKRKMIARRERLLGIRAKLQAKLDRLDAILAPVLFALRTPDEMKADARAFLVDAMQKLGTLGSPEVLMAVMKKKYPKVIVRARTSSAASQPDHESQVSPEAKEALDAGLADARAGNIVEEGPQSDPDPEPDSDASAPPPPAEPASEPKKSKGEPEGPTFVVNVLDREGMTLAQLRKACGLDKEAIEQQLRSLVTLGIAETFEAVENKGKKTTRTVKYRLTAKQPTEETQP